MKKNEMLLAVLALVILISHSASAQTERPAKIKLTLPTEWRFHEAGKPDWYPATVPGCVHTDLLKNKLIEDPFWRDNEQKQQWIGKTDWEYQTTLNLTPEMLKHEMVEVVFEGLDTYAEVFLNDQSLLQADNMFRTWRADAKPLLKPGPNTLRIRFRSPINEVLPIMAKMSYELPAGNDQGEKTSPHTRKAPYQYGWDWGPRFVTSGIWRPAYLEVWDKARLADLQILPRNVTIESASVTANVEVVARAGVNATVILDNLTDKTIAAKRDLALQAGSNQVSLDFALARPTLWWPNGLGAHPLYSFRARLILNGKLSDEATVRTGMRSIELRQEASDGGKSFMFVVNGIPVFAKGGNWIPADSFPTRITEEKYRQLLASVRDSNMNMLRVWGGGIYERDDFYDRCDEMGILIWQDFMFGCSLYPGDQAFLDNVRQEASDNVKRLRNHPSIALWVGNNEIESGWFHWGWKSQYPASLWDDYRKIFYGVLPEVCNSLDPSRSYWPSSPSSNLEDDPESQQMGDLHYWQVWHASSPFSEYEKQSPRFMSEYGFQSFPQIETIRTYTVDADRDIKSPVMMAHQRHPRGNQLIREYMLREYPEPKDFESFLYVSQILQAEGIKIGAEHLRRIMPHNMGSLFWQIDDCWPVASWSSIDYTGRWKALQYYSKRFYSEILVSPKQEKGNIEFFVVSDRLSPASAQLKVSLADFDGNKIWGQEQTISVAPLTSKSYLALPIDGLTAGRDVKRIFLTTELVVGDRTVSINNCFFQPFKNLSLPRPQVKADVVTTRTGFKVKLSTDKFARAVYLSAGNVKGFFVDNFFDLVPSKDAEVEFTKTGAIRLEEFRRQFRVRTLVDAF